MYKTDFNERTIIYHDDFIIDGNDKYYYENMSRLMHDEKSMEFSFVYDGELIILPYKRGELSIILPYYSRAMHNRFENNRRSQTKKKKKTQYIILIVAALCFVGYFIFSSLPLETQVKINPIASKYWNEQRYYNGLGDTIGVIRGNNVEITINIENNLEKNNITKENAIKFYRGIGIDDEYCTFYAQYINSSLNKRTNNKNITVMVKVMLNDETVVAKAERISYSANSREIANNFSRKQHEIKSNVRYLNSQSKK